MWPLHQPLLVTLLKYNFAITFYVYSSNEEIFLKI